mgnify:CR=1 FL=1
MREKWLLHREKWFRRGRNGCFTGRNGCFTGRNGSDAGEVVPTRENWLLHILAVCRRTSFCSRGILTPPQEDAVRNRGY